VSYRKTSQRVILNNDSCTRGQHKTGAVGRGLWEARHCSMLTDDDDDVSS